MHPDLARHQSRVARSQAVRRNVQSGGLGDIIPEALKHPLDAINAKYREFKSKGPMYAQLRHRATVAANEARSRGDSAAYARAIDAQASVRAAHERWMATNEKLDALVAQVRSYGIDPGLGVIPAVVLTAVVASAAVVLAGMAARISEARQAEAVVAAIQSGRLTPEQAVALNASDNGTFGGELGRSLGKGILVAGVVVAAVLFGPRLLASARQAS